ncbi:segregation and condensation protein A [Desulfatirhabdium butyrativorans]|uniref:segregation and condensation protein A n=1 Tax=Desulfatirhabdium butyrativorans TaxID=340467 RepID=UPI0004047B0C|nr:segregation/condensation protein A [Desulfatirhabdium butyrativorans]
MLAEPFRVHIGDIFEGPMDLLIYLIRKHDIDVTDIPIAEITERYLHTMEIMQEMNIDIAGDFLIMAATLVSIKARILLPVSETAEQEDPRMEIARPILDYLRLKSGATQLRERPLLDDMVFGCRIDESAAEPAEQTFDVDLFALFGAFESVLQRIMTTGPLVLEAHGPSIEERIQAIRSMYSQGTTVPLTELLQTSESKIDAVITFLAVLEMARQGMMELCHDPGDGCNQLTLVFRSCLP